MKNSKECDIVKDLLPNYIENLTNENTNVFVEEHLKECTSCSQILSKMKKDISIDNNTSTYTKETNFFKKYNKRMKFLKAIIFLIIIIFFLIIARRMFILYSLQNKVSKYENLDNFYTRVYYYNDDIISIHHAYRKGNKIKEKVETINPDGTSYMTLYGKTDSNISNMYIETNNVKLADLGVVDRIYVNVPIGYSKIDNFWYMFLIALSSNITTEKCNGIECYKIDSSASVNQGEFTRYKQTKYIDKETGLPVRLIDTENIDLSTDKEVGQIHDYKYEFGTVTDEEFKEPDITEYKVQENH